MQIDDNSAKRKNKKPAHMSGLLDGVADSGGFEPPTARFVAEYSIQLSYESVVVVLDQITTGC